MQQYNYAEEIIKNDDHLFAKGEYVRSFHLPEDDIVNEQVQNTTINSEDDHVENDSEETENKVNAYKEGTKNDNIEMEEDIDATKQSEEDEA